MLREKGLIFNFSILWHWVNGIVLNLISGLGSDVDSKRKCAASKRRCKEVEETKDKSEQSAVDALKK